MSWYLVSFPDLLHCEANTANLPVVPISRAEPAKATLTSLPCTRSFVIRIHETGHLALRPTPRRTCPSSGSCTAATHSGTRTTRSFERERHYPLNDATPRYPRRKDLRVYRLWKPYTAHSAKLALRIPARLIFPNKEDTRFVATPLDSAREHFLKFVFWRNYSKLYE